MIARGAFRADVDTGAAQAVRDLGCLRRPGLRQRGAVVRPEDSAEPLPGLDGEHRLGLGLAVDQPVPEALMIAIQVIQRCFILLHQAMCL